MTAKRDLGNFGERVARHHLEERGLTIVAANVRVPAGEIDLVAADAATGETVFAEVRSRRAGPGGAAETLTPAKLRRMWQCAMEYCEREGRPPECARLDLVSIDLDSRGRVVAVDHLRGLELPPD